MSVGHLHFGKKVQWSRVIGLGEFSGGVLSGDSNMSSARWIILGAVKGNKPSLCHAVSFVVFRLTKSGRGAIHRVVSC